MSQRQLKLQFEKPSDDVRKVEGNMSLFIAEHCAFKVVDHVSALCCESFSDSKRYKDLKLKRSKCSAIICT